MPSNPGFCSSCGKEVFEGAQFCTYCGTQAPVAGTPIAAEEIPYVYEVKSVGIWSLVKFAIMMNGFIGLIFGIIVAAIGMSGMIMTDLPIPIEAQNLVGTGAWIAVIVIFPLIYGILGAILGLIMGFIYNIFAWGVGGIRLTLRKT